MMAGRGRLLLSLVAVLALAGCAGLPTSSPVSPELPISASPVEAPPNIFPNPPRDGESARQIVSDFLKANSGPDEDYRIAREYLTASASNTWNPSGQTTMVTTGEQDYDIVQQYGGPVRVTGNALAVLDGNGELTELPSHRQTSANFQLSKVAGQWRISKLPSGFGSWISLADFNRLYVSQQVYFADSATRTLVPDTRWYLSSGEATALARAVLGTPPAWMNGMSHPRMPTGTRLEVDAVPVDSSGLAKVDLSSQALQADSTTRRGTWAAMIATLDQLPKVHNVQLTVGGSPLAVGTDPLDITGPSALGYRQTQPSTGPIILRNGDQLTWSDPNASAGRPRLVRPADGRQQKLPSLNANWTAVASDRTGRQVAAVSADGSSLSRWVDGHQTIMSFGSALTTPTFTPFKELWVAGHEPSQHGSDPNPSGAAVWVIDTSLPAAQAQPQVVSTPWLGSSQVVAMKASPGGDRMALVVRSPSGDTRLLLAGIVRNAKGVPIALSKPARQGQSVTAITDVTWLDPVTLAVLGFTSSGTQRQPVVVPIGGLATPLGPAAGAERIVGTGVSLSDIYLVTDHNTVLRLSGQRWQEYGSGSDVIDPGA